MIRGIYIALYPKTQSALQHFVEDFARLLIFIIWTQKGNKKLGSPQACFCIHKLSGEYVVTIRPMRVFIAKPL